MLLESARSVYKAGQKSISRTCPTPFGVAPNYILPYGLLVSTHWPMVLVLDCTIALTKEEKMAPNLNSFQMHCAGSSFLTLTFALCWFFAYDSDFCINIRAMTRGIFLLEAHCTLVTSHLQNLSVSAEWIPSSLISYYSLRPTKHVVLQFKSYPKIHVILEFMLSFQMDVTNKKHCTFGKSTHPLLYFEGTF